MGRGAGRAYRGRVPFRRLRIPPLPALIAAAALAAAAGADSGSTPRTYRVEQTWQIAPLLAPERVAVEPDAIALGCGAGDSDAGVLRIGEDLAFQTRAGPLATRCRFRTRGLELRAGWRLGAVVWRPTGLLGGLCRVRDLSVDADTDTRVAERRFEIACAPSRSRDTGQDHAARAVLERIELVGPPGGDWRDAFDASLPASPER